MRRDAGNLLGGEYRGRLFDFAVEASGESAQFGERFGEGLRRGGRRALGVEGVGGEAEADDACVAFFRGGEELRQARVPAEQQREHARRHGIERAEMADGALAGSAAHDVHHVMRGQPGGLIYNQ